MELPLAIFQATLALAGVVLFVPSAVLLLECAAAWLPRRRAGGAGDTAGESRGRGRMAVLIPAHNESATLPATLAAVMPQLAEGDRVLVVADNCTDDTAGRARAAGAEVLERTDAVRRGKGYALAAGLEHLGGEAGRVPDVVVLLDADVPPPPGSLDTLARQARSSGRPMQAVYLLRAVATDSPRAVISELAFLVKNRVRPLGLHRLGCPVLLTGTGIAVPWAALRRVDVASGDLVEDMKLGLDLLRAGSPPLLCEDVTLQGELPGDAKAALTQRTRWEQGHLSIIRRYALPMLALGLRRPGSGALAVGLDLLVPPLALLVAMVGLVVLGAALGVAVQRVLTGAAGWSLWCALPAVMSAAAVAAAVVLSYVGFGRHLPLRALAAVPLYIVWKLPLYLRALTGRGETKWVRTARNAAESDGPHP
ncbi:MAG: glycosyltransferase family 2 protein [Tepidisphaerales bacterium]